MEYKERKRILFLGLPWTFTVYHINEEGITVNTGFLNREENDCFLYKVQDVVLRNSLIERIFGLGTVECLTGDVTNPKLLLTHIKHSKEIKDFISVKSEEARIRRRTLATMDVGARPDDINVNVDFDDAE